LYPIQTEKVNVKVYPKGELSYTDPVYDPKNGWTVEAHPNGHISNLSTQHQTSIQSGYLYYESKLLDGAIQKPQTGWVVGYNDFVSF
jgi:uncharacterized protein YcnI